MSFSSKKHGISAANQESRVDNSLTGSLQSQLETIRANIRDFKESKVWTFFSSLYFHPSQ